MELKEEKDVVTTKQHRNFARPGKETSFCGLIRMPLYLGGRMTSQCWFAILMLLSNSPELYARELVNNLHFPGHYYDQETGLYYNWHRFYDPETGRYLTIDPIDMYGGMNLYSYAKQQPTRFSDALGLKWDSGDFWSHYVSGVGSSISLAEIGLLEEFVTSESVSNAIVRVSERYRDMMKKKLFDQCDGCIEKVSTFFHAHHFDESYNVTSASTNLFPVGKGELFNEGECVGVANCTTGRWTGSCNLHFYIRDWFEEPFDVVGMEVGKPYRINGDWNDALRWSE